LGAERIELSPADIGGWIRHRAWKLNANAAAQIVWPVYPHNPYANGPEITRHAVGSPCAALKPQIEDWTVLPGERELAFELEVD
jgi:hypothetical protein